MARAYQDQALELEKSSVHIITLCIFFGVCRVCANPKLRMVELAQAAALETPIETPIDELIERTKSWTFQEINHKIMQLSNELLQMQLLLREFVCVQDFMRMSAEKQDLHRAFECAREELKRRGPGAPFVLMAKDAFDDSEEIECGVYGVYNYRFLLSAREIDDIPESIYERALIEPLLSINYTELLKEN